MYLWYLVDMVVTVGIDEVGRGCWAGPVVAGAVILGAPIKGLKDSKKLSKKQRESLAVEIEQNAVAIGLGWVEAPDIDRLGITTAVKMAMERALQQISIRYDEIIIDGHINFLDNYSESKALIKADDSIPSVSAASIVAKVARDKFMTEITDKYPSYGFEQHVGYGTALHLERLKLYGVTDLHRMSFKPIHALIQ